MKKIMFSFFSVLLFTFILYAKDIKESQVPKKVRDYVENKYPKAVGKEWEYKNKNNTFYYYKVEFKVEGREVDLEIDTDGNLLSSKEEINVKEAPSFIKKYITENYLKANILGVKKKVKGGIVTYDAGITFNNNGNIRHRNIYFNEKGEVIKN